MNSKKNLSTLLIILSTICLLSCTHNVGESYDSEVLGEIPSGFILLEKSGYWENGLHYLFWENMIVFQDSDDVTIYQIGLNQSYFIVKYKKDYYINEEKLEELLEIADISPEQRRKVYKIGETVEIRGKDKCYLMTIKEIENVEGSGINDIKFSIIPDVNEDELHAFFSFAEIKITDTNATGTDNGFIYIDSETIRLEMKADRQIIAIVINSPDYLGLTYKISVSG